MQPECRIRFARCPIHNDLAYAGRAFEAVLFFATHPYERVHSPDDGLPAAIDVTDAYIWNILAIMECADVLIQYRNPFPSDGTTQFSIELVGDVRSFTIEEIHILRAAIEFTRGAGNEICRLIPRYPFPLREKLYELVEITGLRFSLEDEQNQYLTLFPNFEPTNKGFCETVMDLCISRRGYDPVHSKR